MSEVDLDALDALHAAATSGEWRAWRCSRAEPDDACAIRTPRTPEHHHGGDIVHDTDHGECWHHMRAADAAFIAAAHNLLPHIVAELRAARSTIAALRAALRAHGGCSAVHPVHGECTWDTQHGASEKHVSWGTLWSDSERDVAASEENEARIRAGLIEGGW